MARVFVGNLDSRISERDLEDEFREFGVIKSVWVARRPPGYAFVEFDDRRDALDAISAVDGKHGWRVELSHTSKGGGGGRGGYGDSRGGRGDSRGGPRGRGSDMSCYECGEPGHFARECSLRIGSGGSGSGRRRSPGPTYRRSPEYGRRSPGPNYRRSPSYGRRSPSPRGRSPRRRERSRSRSPRYSRRESPPYDNGSPGKDRRRSYSPRPAKQSPHRRPISPPINGDDGLRSQS